MKTFLNTVSVLSVLAAGFFSLLAVGMRTAIGMQTCMSVAFLAMLFAIWLKPHNP